MGEDTQLQGWLHFKLYNAHQSASTLRFECAFECAFEIVQVGEDIASARDEMEDLQLPKAEEPAPSVFLFFLMRWKICSC